MRTQATFSPMPPMRVASFVGLFATGLLLSGLVGGVTNSINGAVSPLYFVHVMQWYDVTDVWRASIGQGVLEGLVSGTVLSLVFTSSVGLISRLTCPYTLGMRYIAGMLTAICGCWFMGGLLGIVLALLSPEFYRNAFIDVPSGTGEMVKYAWVGGSIWGTYFGAVAALVLMLVVVRVKWHRQVESAMPHLVAETY